MKKLPKPPPECEWNIRKRADTGNLSVFLEATGDYAEDVVRRSPRPDSFWFRVVVARTMVAIAYYQQATARRREARAKRTVEFVNQYSRVQYRRESSSA